MTTGMNELDPQVRVGEVLAGKYRVERILGVGGMGVVIAARHIHLDEMVAIKMLLPSIAHNADIVQRFLREGRAMIKIRSEHAVKVHDVGVLDSGTPYMVMEYLEGQDLEKLLESRGPLPVQELVDLVLQGCEAIAEAHALGIVHRDLKPANLFLTHRADGSPAVKVLDFGISKAQTQGAPLDMTRTSVVMGSPRYMSPEQMRSARGVDARSDIWALGTIVYELCAGKPPFDGGTMTELCAQILQDPQAPLGYVRPGVPPELDAVISRALEKDPNRRFQNLAEFSTALAELGSPSAKSSAARVARVLRVETAALERPSSPDLGSNPGFVAPALTINDVSSPVGPATSQIAVTYGSTTATMPRKSSSGVVLGVLAAGGLVLVLGIAAVIFVMKSSAAAPAADPVAGPTAAAQVPSAEAASSPPPATVVPEVAPSPAESASVAAPASAPPAKASAKPEAPSAPTTSKTSTSTKTGTSTKASTSTKTSTKPSGDLPFSGRNN